MMKRIMDAISYSEILNFVEIGRRTGMCRHTIAKYVVYLEADKKLFVERNGQWRRVFKRSSHTSKKARMGHPATGA